MLLAKASSTSPVAPQMDGFFHHRGCSNMTNSTSSTSSSHIHLYLHVAKEEGTSTPQLFLMDLSDQHSHSVIYSLTRSRAPFMVATIHINCYNCNTVNDHIDFILVASPHLNRSSMLWHGSCPIRNRCHIQ